jgi:hypothetical protein
VDVAPTTVQHLSARLNLARPIDQRRSHHSIDCRRDCHAHRQRIAMAEAIRSRRRISYRARCLPHIVGRSCSLPPPHSDHSPAAACRTPEFPQRRHAEDICQTNQIPMTPSFVRAELDLAIRQKLLHLPEASMPVPERCSSVTVRSTRSGQTVAAIPSHAPS